MPDFEEGAENILADAPPADSTDTNIDANELDTDQELVSPEPEHLDTETEDADQPEATPEREGYIPRARFDEVNTERKLEAEARARLEAELQQARAEKELLTKAHAAGYADINEYQRWDNWAKANNYGSIEAYNELSAYSNTLNQRVLDGDLSEESRLELYQARQERLQLKSEVEQARQLLKTVQTNTLDQTIASAKAQFEVSEEQWKPIEDLMRKIGNPAGVQEVIKTFAPVLRTSTKKAATDAVIEHNEKKSAERNSPVPMSRGKASPVSSAKDDMSWKNKSFTQLAREAGWFKQKHSA